MRLWVVGMWVHDKMLGSGLFWARTSLKGRNPHAIRHRRDNALQRYANIHVASDVTRCSARQHFPLHAALTPSLSAPNCIAPRALTHDIIALSRIPIFALGPVRIYGLWFMVHGSWFMIHGLWFMICLGYRLHSEFQ